MSYNSLFGYGSHSPDAALVQMSADWNDQIQ